jgi:spore maturation protein CgeB
LIDWRPGLGALFEETTEVVSFRGLADLREKVTYYLARPDERETVAAAGQRRAARDHTYAIRLAHLLRACMGEQTPYVVDVGY